MAGEDEGHRGQPSRHYTGARASPGDLAHLLGRVARELEAETSLDATMNAMVAAAVDAVPGAELGGVTQVRRRQEIDVQYASDPLAKELDAAQYQLQQGPCLDAAYRHRTVRVDDFETERRWPAFAARAHQLGARSLLSVQLFVQGDDLGALNLYSRQPQAFDDESEQVGLVFATHAAIALSGARREQQLHIAISGRDIIGQAKGILMERYKLTADQAFAVLTRASAETQIKLRDVAEALAGTGEVPRP